VKAEVLKAFSEELPPAVVSEREKLHSLFFLISKAQLYIVEEFLKSGKHRISKLHELLKSKKVDFKRFELLDYQRRSLINLNRVEEFYETVCGQTD
jgi:molybdopterin-guanine dinucleotide biosynthesis protein A